MKNVLSSAFRALACDEAIESFSKMNTGSKNPITVVFDVGNVLIGWDPENLYRRLIPDDDARRHFLTYIAPHDWNVEQDKGRSWHEAVTTRSAEFPEYRALIEAYDHGWQEMLSGAIDGSVEILHTLHTQGTPLYAITNFSAEKWALTLTLFPFFDRFCDIIVSAHERVIKPELEIYHILLRRNSLVAEDCIFIDDMPKNVAAARSVGMHAVQFENPAQLRGVLKEHGFAV